MNIFFVRMGRWKEGGGGGGWRMVNLWIKGLPLSIPFSVFGCVQFVSRKLISSKCK
jgi:hypothetical protein